MPQVRVAQFYHGAAAELLCVQIVDQLAKVPKQRNGRAKKALQQARQALRQGEAVERALAEARKFVPNSKKLGGGSPRTRCLLMDLVDAVYFQYRSAAGSGSSEAGGSGGGENAKAVQAAGALAVHVQLAWSRAVDEECCRLGPATDDFSPLFRWCETDNVDAVRMLLDHASVDANRAETSDGATPLFIACQNGHTDVVRALLVHASVDVNRVRADDGSTPLFIACQNGHTDVVRALLGHAGVDVNRVRTDNGCTPLFAACVNGHIDAMRALLGHAGIDVNRARVGDGATPLFAACVNGHIDAMRALLGHAGVDANRARVDDGATPLHAACLHGRAQFVHMLLDHACVNVDQVTTDEGESPLFIACQKGHAEAARMLLAAGARADLPATGGGGAITCLQVVQREGHMEVLALLEGASTKLMRKRLGSKHIETSKVLLAEQAAEQAAEMELAAAEEKEKLAEVNRKLAEVEWDSDDEPESMSSEWDSDDEPESLSPAQFAIVQATKQLAALPAACSNTDGMNQ
jgi:ankyrin repeat protein